MPFAVTFQPRLKFLQKSIGKNLCLLYMNEEVKKAFRSKPMISYRSFHKINSYLVRTKLYSIKEQLVVTNVKCVSILKKLILLLALSHGETFKINHRFDCNDKYLVYLMSCNKCKKQYTGQTTDHFCSRWSNYKSKSSSFDRGEQCMQKHLYKHFQNERHSGFRDDVLVILTAKTDDSNPTKS